jgi:protein-disulfide isomerase
LTAAVAARAAQDQGKFWEYHDLLYRNQSGGYPLEKLLGLAGEAGLDVERFESDLADPDRYTEVVADDFRKGQQRGISGTPTFVINGRVIAGLQPLEVYEEAIAEAKSEAEGGS